MDPRFIKAAPTFLFLIFYFLFLISTRTTFFIYYLRNKNG